MFTFITKDIPTKFVILQGVGVNADDVFCILENFVDNDEINKYNLNEKVADILVNEGILNKRTGSRNATLYCKTKKFDFFYDSYTNEFLNEE